MILGAWEVPTVAMLSFDRQNAAKEDTDALSAAFMASIMLCSFSEYATMLRSPDAPCGAIDCNSGAGPHPLGWSQPGSPSGRCPPHGAIRDRVRSFRSASSAMHLHNLGLLGRNLNPFFQKSDPRYAMLFAIPPNYFAVHDELHGVCFALPRLLVRVRCSAFQFWPSFNRSEMKLAFNL